MTPDFNNVPFAVELPDGTWKYMHSLENALLEADPHAGSKIHEKDTRKGWVAIIEILGVQMRIDLADKIVEAVMNEIEHSRMISKTRLIEAVKPLLAMEQSALPTTTVGLPDWDKIIGTYYGVAHGPLASCASGVSITTIGTGAANG